jgi:membrane protease YdiL (CAAX protease family)
MTPNEFEPLPGQPAPPDTSDLPAAEQTTEVAPGFPASQATNDLSELPLFRSWAESGYEPWNPTELATTERTPNLAHLLIFAANAILALLLAGLLTRLALRLHLYGVNSWTKASTDIHYTLGSMGVLYLGTLLLSLLIFPLIWHQSFFRLLHWNAEMLQRPRAFLRLVGAALVCFLLAMLSGILLPGPKDAPIDKIFRTPGAAWLLFAFGVTFAPFFEEILFRGLLLPTLCTGLDWINEKANGRRARLPFPDGHPRWSRPAMIAAAILTSIPFAFMHAEQTGYSLGPFLLLVTVSLILCWARLSFRSLAASVFVHACYNFTIFSLMFIGTGGFQHLDKM